MKKGRLSILAIAAIVACCFTAIGCSKKAGDEHEHEFGSWAITEQPTQDAGGKITRTCTALDGAAEVVDVPALSDTEFWSVSTTPATHVDAQKLTYSNATYDVKFTVDGEAALGHTWGEWSVKESARPTTTSGGKIVATCTENDGGVKEMDVPNLNDTTFWTVTTTPAGHVTPGSHVYSNAQYKVTHTVPIPATGHTYGKWAFVTGKVPTANQGGQIIHTCTENDGGAEIKDVPKFTDTSFWTAGLFTAPGHETDGSQVYTNTAHGISYTLTLPATGHTWEPWEFALEPTEYDSGYLMRTCSAGDGTQTVKVPKLTDTTFWDIDEIPVSYNTAGYKTYTPKPEKNIDFEHRVKTGDKLVAPYDNQTYYTIAYQITSDGFINRNSVKHTSWVEAHLELGGENCNEGVGNGQPFQNKHVTITMVDAETGRINFTIVDSDSKVEEAVGYVCMDYDNGTKQFVHPVIIYQDSKNDYYLFTPFVQDDDNNGHDGAYYANEASAAWTFTNESGFACKGLAVSYECGEDGDVLNFYLEESATGDFVVHFGVTFENAKKNGSAVLADTIYGTSEWVYVKDADGNILNSFGFDGESMRVLDGFEGAYEGSVEDDAGEPVVGAPTEFTLDGMGGVKEDRNAHYDILGANEIGLYIGGCYYELTLDSDGSFDGTKPMVKVSFYYVNGLDDDQVAEVNHNKNIELGEVLEEKTPTTAEGFMGWFLDEGTWKQPVSKNYIPTADVGIYARWSTTFVWLHIEGEEDQDQSNIKKVYFNVGDTFVDIASSYVVTPDVGKNRYLVGWYFYNKDSQKTPVPMSTLLVADDSNLHIYADWAELPEYFGAYQGAQLLSSTFGSSAQVTIDENGRIIGSIFTGGNNQIEINGTITAYENGRITYNDNGTKYMWFDVESGLLVIPDDLTKTEIDTFPFLLAKDGVNVEGFASGFGFHDGASTFQDKTKLVSYDDGKMAFIYTNHIYSDVSITDAYGATIATPAAAKASKTLVITYSNGDPIIAFGTTADSFEKSSDELGANAERKLLDGYYGVYTDSEFGTVKVDGLGTMTFDGKKATYEHVVAGDYFDVFVYEVETKTTPSDDDDDTTTSTSYKKIVKEYFKMILDGTSCTLEKVMVTLTFKPNLPGDAAGADGVVEKTVSVNANIIFALDLSFNYPDIDNYVFGGWYTNEECTGEKLDSVTIKADTSIYAKWLVKHMITLYKNHKQEVEDLAPVYVGHGLVADEIPDPEVSDESVVFMGWYLEPDYVNMWNPATPVTEDFSLYAKWGSPAYAHLYYHFRISGISESGTDSKSYDGTIEFNAKGYASGGGYPFNSGNAQQINNYDDVNGTFVMYNASSSGFGVGNHYGYVDVESGMMYVNWNVGDFGNADITRAVLLVPSTIITGSVYDVSGWKESYWNSGKTRAITFVYDDVTYSLFVHKNVVYFDASFKTADEADVAGDACYRSPTLYVYDKNDELIFKFGYDGSVMNEYDGYEDITYAGALGNLTVDGINTIHIGDKEGTYSLASAGAGYTADVYIDGKYYEITLNKAAETYTHNMPMVDIEFVTDYDTAHAATMNVNKNIGVTLPHLTDATYIFRGWFTDESCNHPVALVEGKFVPVNATTTLYAKWDVKATLTVVYATITHDGITNMQNATKEYGVGDSLDLKEFIPNPIIVNGKAFVGWYRDRSCTQEFNDETIDGDITVYAKWVDPVPMYGDYYGWNLFGAGSKTPGSTSTSSKSLIIHPDGKVTGSKEGNIMTDAEHEYNPETGVFYIQSTSGTIYYLVYDAVSGAIGVADGSSNTNFGDDMDLFFTKFLASTGNGNSATLGQGGNLTGGKLVTVKFVDDTTQNLFVTNTRVYGGVTWEATNSSGKLEEYTAQNAGNAYALIIWDSNGDVITVRRKVGSTWSESTLDKYAGAYTYSGTGIDLGKLTLNGIGVVKLSDTTGTYKIVDSTYSVDMTVNSTYYRVTLNTTEWTYVCNEPKATLVFHSNGGSEIESITVNLNSQVPVGSADYTPVWVGYIFDGWYFNSDLSGSKASYNYTVTTEGTIDLYAKWTEGYVLRIHVAEDTTVVTLSKNATIKIASGTATGTSNYNLNYPVCPEGKMFYGWFTDDGFNNPYTPGSLTGNLDLYAKLVDAQVTVNYGTSSYIWTVTSDGDNTVWKSGGKGTNNATSAFTITASVAGVLMFDYRVDSESSDKLSIKKGSTTYYEGGGTGNPYTALQIVLMAGESVTITYKKDGSGNNGEDAAFVRNIVFAAFDNTLEGDYTWVDHDSIHLDGQMTITWGEKTGTYMPMDAENTFDVYFQEGGVNVEHYTLVLNRVNSTYTLTENKVTVTYEMNGYGTAPSETSVWNNISWIIPEPDAVAGMAFKGWFTDDGLRNKVTAIAPTEDITLYAKWAETISVNVHMNGNGADTTIPVVEGEVIYPPFPAYSNGKAFEGWYIDPECKNKLNTNDVATKDGISDIYAKWIETTYAMYGEYKGVELYASTSYTDLIKSGSQISRAFSVNETGNVTGKYTATVSSYNPESNTFKYKDDGQYATYDSKYGIVAESYNGSATNLSSSDIWIYFRDAIKVEISAKLANKDSSGTSMWVSVLTVTRTNGSTFNVLVYNEKVYGGVTWNEGVSALDTKNQDTLVVKDENGNTIITIDKATSTATPA
ncbi:MAG: InlB B-repeat-containing protein [Clostridiales bacterium]|nr:InlB B-repeat-containing protein [Clostridiales bacterium]